MAPLDRQKLLEMQDPLVRLLLQQNALLKQNLAAAELRIERLQEQHREEIARLLKRIEELERKLGLHSGNSNKPPSSDPPSKAQTRRRQSRAPKARKKRKGTRRELVPPDEVDVVVDLFPSHCEHCAHIIEEPSPELDPRRYQQVDLAPLLPVVTEWRRHAVPCPKCRAWTRAPYDPAVIPQRAFGPRVDAVVVMLTGVYHLSRRKTAQLLDELLGLTISIGTISNIERRTASLLEPVVAEAWERALDAPVKHVDGTGWRQRGRLRALWVVATSMLTVFRVLTNGRGETLRAEILPRETGILVSDRASALQFWAMERRQICWAHLLRLFVGFSERDGPAGALGRELLDLTGVVFDLWKGFREGKSNREELQWLMKPVRALFESTVQRVAASQHEQLSGSCLNLWVHRAALWTFVDQDDVEPTNNHAERELRAFVLWRKRSYGSQSERGSRFAERVMSVAHTARKQGLRVLDFIEACCRSGLKKTSMPSLFQEDVAV